MAKYVDNSLLNFTQRPSRAPLAIIGVIVFLCLVAGLISTISAQNWILVAIFAVSIVGMAVFAFFGYSQSRKLSAETDGRRIDWETALPEIQRQNLNLEVFELSKLLEVESGQISDLQSAYIVAEDLALRQIQQEENVSLMRHVSVGKAPFDAVLAKDGAIVCVEVAFLVAPDIRQEKIDAVIRKVATVKKAFGRTKIGMKVRLMLVLVTQLTREDEERLRSVLTTRRFSMTPVDIDIRLLDFEALQRIYVTD